MGKKIIIIAGEPSGDLQAGLLVSRLKQLDNNIQIFAVGGSFLKKTGAEILYDIKGLSVLGLFDVLKKLSKFAGLMRFMLKSLAEIRPEGLIFVDFSGFNLRLAKRIKPDWPLKTIYYISPQVWASRPGRIKTIKKFIDKMIVIFKFEQAFYKRFGIEAELIDHPLLDIVKPTMNRSQALFEFGLKENSPVFALLPGSRISEVRNILPVMLKCACIIREKIPQAQFVISKPANLDMKLYSDLLRDNLKDTKIIEALPYDCLNVADFVLVASGSATLETAIMEKPNVIIYKIGLLNYLLYRPLIKIPFIGMENIVAGKMIAPEFIQFRARPKLIASVVLAMLLNQERLAEMRECFLELKKGLGLPGGPLKAAETIYNFLYPAKNKVP